MSTFPPPSVPSKEVSSPLFPPPPPALFKEILPIRDIKCSPNKIDTKSAVSVVVGGDQAIRWLPGGHTAGSEPVIRRRARPLSFSSFRRRLSSHTMSATSNNNNDQRRQRPPATSAFVTPTSTTSPAAPPPPSPPAAEPGCCGCGFERRAGGTRSSAPKRIKVGERFRVSHAHHPLPSPPLPSVDSSVTPWLR